MILFYPAIPVLLQTNLFRIYFELIWKLMTVLVLTTKF